MVRDLLESLLSSIVYDVDELVLTCSQNMTAFGFRPKHTEICKYRIVLEILVILDGFSFFFFFFFSFFFFFNTQIKKTGRGKTIVFTQMKNRIPN